MQYLGKAQFEFDCLTYHDRGRGRLHTQDLSIGEGSGGISSIYSNAVMMQQWEECKVRAEAMGMSLIEEKLTVSAHVLDKDLNTKAVLSLWRAG